MSAISAPGGFTELSAPEADHASLRDVTDSDQSRGRRGIFFGGAFGFVLGAIFVAIPFSTQVLAFGILGTLLIGAIECAVIAGAFAAMAAALLANRDGGRGSPSFERIANAGRRAPADIPPTERPARRADSAQTVVHPVLRAPDPVSNPAYSLPDVQAWLNTIDAWENGNTGP